LYFTDRAAEAKIYATTSTNLTALVGSTIKLGCETNTESKIRWYFNSPRLQRPAVYYNGFKVGSTVAWRVSVTQTNKLNELTIRNMEVNGTGVYSCHELATFRRNVNFYVTVKGKIISCFTCSITMI